jgi:hypothetical protein
MPSTMFSPAFDNVFTSLRQCFHQLSTMFSQVFDNVFIASYVQQLRSSNGIFGVSNGCIRVPYNHCIGYTKWQTVSSHIWEYYGDFLAIFGDFLATFWVACDTQKQYRDVLSWTLVLCYMNIACSHHTTGIEPCCVASQITHIWSVYHGA